MTARTKGNLLKWAGLGLDVGAPLTATLLQFPAMVQRSSTSTVSGLFVVFALLSAIPLLKQFGKMIKTPSVPILWLIGFGVLLCLRSIVDEMIVVCAVGAISNGIGTVMYKCGERLALEEGKK